VGLHGEKMNNAVQNYVATPVTIHADAVQYDDWIVLYMQSTGIKNYAFHLRPTRESLSCANCVK